MMSFEGENACLSPPLSPYTTLGEPLCPYPFDEEDHEFCMKRDWSEAVENWNILRKAEDLEFQKQFGHIELNKSSQQMCLYKDIPLGQMANDSEKLLNLVNNLKQLQEADASLLAVEYKDKNETLTLESCDKDDDDDDDNEKQNSVTLFKPLRDNKRLEMLMANVPNEETFLKELENFEEILEDTYGYLRRKQKMLSPKKEIVKTMKFIVPISRAVSYPSPMTVSGPCDSAMNSSVETSTSKQCSPQAEPQTGNNVLAHKTLKRRRRRLNKGSPGLNSMHEAALLDNKYKTTPTETRIECAIHPTEIRTSISPYSAVELNMTSALANYATEAARVQISNILSVGGNLFSCEKLSPPVEVDALDLHLWRITQKCRSPRTRGMNKAYNGLEDRRELKTRARGRGLKRSTGMERIVPDSPQRCKRPVMMMVMMVDSDRIKEVGPDRACAEWLMKNGAFVKWENESDFLKNYDCLPPEDDRRHIVEVDATEASITYLGFAHFRLPQMAKVGSDLAIQGQITLPLTMQTLEINFTFLVFDELREPLILRQPSFMEQKVILDYENSRTIFERLHASEGGLRETDPVVKNCNHIRKVKLDKCAYVDDRALQEMKYLAQPLQQLHIIKCYNVTDKGVISLKTLRQVEFERTTFVWAALCEAWRKLFNGAKKCVAIVILHVRVNLPLLLPRLRGTDHREERLKPVIQIDESSTLQINRQSKAGLYGLNSIEKILMSVISCELNDETSCVDENSRRSLDFGVLFDVDEDWVLKECGLKGNPVDQCKRSVLRCSGHVQRMSVDRVTRQIH
uniref:(California timema) hypothetical protein n=1 Tax=Timema californicum TaxID=61474 RepID=A0A7R9IUL1_TIMCA|nr:unnamed protein product [Timema californicum]